MSAVIHLACTDVQFLLCVDGVFRYLNLGWNSCRNSFHHPLMYARSSRIYNLRRPRSAQVVQLYPVANQKEATRRNITSGVELTSACSLLNHTYLHCLNVPIAI